jgi:hypothetical protein
MQKRKLTSHKPKTSMVQQELIIYGRSVSRHKLPAEFRIPTSLPDQILTATKVPNQRLSAIRTRIKSAIIERMVSERVDREWNRKKEIRAPFLRIARQTEKLLKSVQQLEPELRRTLTASLTMEEEENFLKLGEFWLPYLGTEVVPYERELRRFAELARRAGAKPKRTVSHRPRFSIRHRALLSLIVRLYELIVETAGGELTLWDDVTHGKLKGTLPAILEILRPILPSTIPDRGNLNYSTLSRFLRQAKNPRKF